MHKGLQRGNRTNTVKGLLARRGLRRACITLQLPKGCYNYSNSRLRLLEIR